MGTDALQAWWGRLTQGETRAVERRLVVFVAIVTAMLYLPGLGHPDHTVGGESHNSVLMRDWLAGAFVSGKQSLPINNEHPPLAKLFLAASMFLFGDNPAAWRLPNVIAGIALACALMLFAWRLTGSLAAGLLAVAVLTLDNHHYVAATNFFLDTIGLAFAFGAFSHVLGTPQHRWVAPVLYGLAIACKLPFLFLFPVFAWLWFRSWGPPGTRWTGMRFAQLGVLMFAPFLFTYLPYIAYWCVVLGPDAALPKLFDSLVAMVVFHEDYAGEGKLTFQWDPLHWFLFTDPPRFYWRVLSATHVAGVWALGNPILWWGGPLLGFLWPLRRGARRGLPPGLSTMWMLMLLQWVPFFFIGRAIFPYYMIKVVPHVAVMMAIVLAAWFRLPRWRPLVWLVLGIALVVFVARFPLSEAWPVTRDYVRLVAPTADFGREL